MARTDADKVKDVMNPGKDYDTDRSPSLTRFINIATAVTDRVNTCATAKGVTLTDSELLEIETLLAAHFYTKSDRVYQSRSELGASGAFVLNKDNPEPYKSAAIEMDPSGCVNAILNGRRASMAWLGLPPSEQTDYRDRD